MMQTVIDYSFMLKQKRRKTFFAYLVFTVVVLSILIVFQNFLLFSVDVASESMQPTLAKGDAAFVTPLAKPFTADTEQSFVDKLLHSISISRGDLILLQAEPQTKLNKFKTATNRIVRFLTFQRVSVFPDLSDNYCVRRILAFPGDTVYMKDFVVYIKPADEDHFLTEYELSSLHYDVKTEKLPEGWNDTIGFAGNMEPVVLRENQYMFFSDDRYHCSDSRLWGSVSGNLIAGKLVLRYWPFQSVSLL